MIVALIDESDLHKWTITMDGPPGSPYAVRKNTIPKTFVTRKLSVTSHPRQKSAVPISPRDSPKFSGPSATLNAEWFFTKLLIYLS
jgi:hypothetical protein